ncbi:hypothetical protein V5H98_12870 [Georgenia sp. M64]|uniref:hypothetical protein n=1 Tax=Georgenia sp. M64 TaxID=3120520 RepID=UPI0030E2F89A
MTRPAEPSAAVPGRAGPTPPPPLLGALAVVALEALALVVAAVVLVAETVRGLALDVGSAVALAVFFVGFATLLGGAGRALWRGSRWGRGPVITWQLLQVATALALAGSLPGWLPVVLVAGAVVVVAGVLWPSSRDHASRTNAPDAVA